MRISACLVCLMMLGFLNMPAKAQKTKPKPLPTQAQLETMAARFAATPLRVDTSKLSAGDQKALVKLIEAARLLDDVFLQQYWSGDTALYAKLQKDKTALGKARLSYFWINKGPWSALDEFEPFIPGVPARKPMGANFYPEDMSKDEFERWVATLPDKDQEQAKGFFTVIRRDGKDLKIVPYSEAYKDDLTKIADLLREAAALTDNDSLKKFLTTRA